MPVFEEGVYFAGGGARGTDRGTGQTYGGLGGGASSLTNASTKNSGIDGTGGGGTGGGKSEDAASGQDSGSNGGSGIVIIRYKYTRTQIQVQDIDSDYKYISFPFISSILDPSLIAYYKFDTPNGLSDSSGSHDLTAINPQFDSSNKISGSSAFEDGTNESYLQFPTSLTDQIYNINNTNGISFAFWYRLDNSSGDWTSIFEFSENASDGSNVQRIDIAKHGSANGLWIGIKDGGNFAHASTIGSGTFDNT